MNAVDSEQKYVAGIAQASFAAAWLAHSCLKDGLFHEGRIHSVYFDTPALDAYEDKANGNFHKIKCRLRWYSPDASADPARATAFMETKRRFGERRRKTRRKLELKRDWLESASLDDPAFADLLTKWALPLEETLPAGLTATALISYERRRFVCPSSRARVSLDTSIEMNRVNQRLIPRTGRVILQSSVVEIKGAAPEQIPWLTALYDAGFRRRSFSKYGECLEVLREGR